jgi:ferritin
MIGKKLEKAFNDQIREEYYSSYLYLSMAAWFESQQFQGMASWMRKQAEEEMGHVMKFFDQVLERGGTVKLAALEAPQQKWASPLAAFSAALDHERHITGCINKLVDLAIAESDHAAVEFLSWFVKEQVEEEATVEPIVHRLKVNEGSPGVLYHMDHQLAKRGKE